MSGPTFLVLDTETTGVDPAKDQVVELGFVMTDLQEDYDGNHYLAKATVPISPEASAVHHILDCDLVNAPPLSETLEHLRARDRWKDAVAYVAHNAPFDRSFLPMLDDKPWLDTLRMAKCYLPDAGHYGNQFLRYFLKLDVPRDIGAHRAEGDCVATAALLRYLINGPAREDFERMGVAGFAAHVDSPLVLQVCNFGKHAGKTWADVPRDYLGWILRQPDFDADVRNTADHFFRR
jgi:exodeoxyribonuclease X